tara:strand:+ start:45110 stop:46198 length:1089 start_codon:yes stop_codon:yes gene_type:complete
MPNNTPLYQQHLDAGGKVVDFHGWNLPIHYGSQIDEHNAVRQDAGMFDVSHMTPIDIVGSQAKDFLRYLLANDVAKLTAPGKALYSCMLNEQAGVIDDLITYYFDDETYRIVVNSSTRENDLAWLNKQSANFDVTVTERDDLAIVAVQGPNAIAKAKQAMTAEQQAATDELLKPFFAKACGEWVIARTGYTGEDGLEIMLPATEVVEFWQALLAADVRPCGLGARDTLRLEAGMNLYGNDMDETVSPLAAGLGWTIAWEPADRDFLGRAVLTAQRENGVQEKLVGLVLEDRGVLRDGQKIIVEDIGEGVTTSGTFSPTMKAAIAFARVPKATGELVKVEIRGKQLAARVVKLPFVRNGQVKV